MLASTRAVVGCRACLSTPLTPTSHRWGLGGGREGGSAWRRTFVESYSTHALARRPCPYTARRRALGGTSLTNAAGFRRHTARRGRAAPAVIAQPPPPTEMTAAEQAAAALEAPELDPAAGEYDWRNAWWPVAFVRDVDPKKPYKFTLLGEDM